MLESNLESGLLSPGSSGNLNASGRRISRRGTSLTRASIMDKIHVKVAVKDLDYYVGPKLDKQILKNVSVQFNPGELVCLMGPSGAGKTTLLSCILGNAGGRVEGSIRVNGIEGPPKDFKSVSKLIPQEDVLIASLTVRETFYYQSDLVLPSTMSRAEKDARIAEVVRVLNLESCLDVKIGSVDERGVSGGQRKRMSIGLDLLSNPAALFVDEPTSGLDSKTAEDVVEQLSRLAHGGSDGYSRTIISTIHQPSYRIFSRFDKVVFLTKGRIAFSGTHEEMERFFDSIDLAVPPKENPADHYMRVLQDDELADKICYSFAQAQKLARIQEGDVEESSTDGTDASSATTYEDQSNPDSLEGEEGLSCRRLTKSCCRALTSCTGCFSRSKQPGVGAQEGSEGNEYDLKTVPKYPTSWGAQFRVLFRRNLYESIKNPHKVLRSTLLKTVVGLLFGFVWWGAGYPPKLSTITSLQGALFCCLMNSCIDTLASTLIVFPSTRSLLIREYRNGSYSLTSFYPALMCSMGILSIMYALIMVVPIYLMVGLQRDAIKFVYFLLTVILMTIIGNTLGVTVGAISKDLVEAQACLMPIVAPLVLFSGFVIQYAQMHQFFRFFYHISFFQYALSGLLLGQLTDINFEIDIPMGNLTLHEDLPGEVILKTIYNLDPETQSAGKYVLILFCYAVVISFGGYFVIQRSLRKKTG